MYLKNKKKIYIKNKSYEELFNYLRQIPQGQRRALESTAVDSIVLESTELEVDVNVGEDKILDDKNPKDKNLYIGITIYKT